MGDPRARPLRETDVQPDPIEQVDAWLAEAEQAGIALPEAMTLATATPDGAPSARMVLLKGLDARGFVFYTDYESRKGRELAANPRGALVLYWHELGRQVRAEGPVGKVAHEESEAYWATRPLGSRQSAFVSPQSEVIPGRKALEAQLRELGDEDVPLPPHWGGYRLEPAAIELWQHREDRLHDRLRYTRERGGWRLERLAP